MSPFIRRPDSTLIGIPVRSAAVGVKGEFVGRIRAVFSHYVHVEDESDGSVWHRSSRDLELIEAAA